MARKIVEITGDVHNTVVSVLSQFGENEANADMCDAMLSAKQMQSFSMPNMQTKANSKTASEPIKPIKPTKTGIVGANVLQFVLPEVLLVEFEFEDEGLGQDQDEGLGQEIEQKGRSIFKEAAEELSLSNSASETASGEENKDKDKDKDKDKNKDKSGSGSNWHYFKNLSPQQLAEKQQKMDEMANTIEVRTVYVQYLVFLLTRIRRMLHAETDMAILSRSEGDMGSEI